MSPLFNMLSRLVIAFLPRNKNILTSWLQSPSAVILEPKTVPLFPHLFARKWWDWMPWSSFFESWVFSQLFHSRLSPYFLPLGWYHLHIWGCGYFSQQSSFQLVSHPSWHFAWCTLHRSSINRVTIYSLDVPLSQFWTSLLFHVWFLLLLLDLHTGFWGGR